MSSQLATAQNNPESKHHSRHFKSTVEKSDQSKAQAVTIIACVTCATGINSLLYGVVTVIIPKIAEDFS